MAATTLVGQHLGAGQPEMARRSGNAALVLAITFMASMGLLYVAVGGWVVAAFNPDPAVIQVGRQLFFFAAAFQMFDAMNMVCGGILRGAGDTRFPMVAAVGFSWLIFLPLIWLLGLHLDFGVQGAWAGATCYIFGLGLTLLWRVRAGQWMKMRVV